MLTPELVNALSKLSMGSIAIAGLIWVLHTAIADDGDFHKIMEEHAERQTAALEKIAAAYTGKP